MSMSYETFEIICRTIDTFFNNWGIVYIGFLFIYCIYCLFTAGSIKIDKLEYNGLTWKDLDLIENKIRYLEPREFEEFIAYLYENLGYKTELTPETIDGGKDVILETEGTKIYVECKHWAEHNLINREIPQKLVGACLADNINYAKIVCTSGLTERAKEYVDKVRDKIFIDVLTMKDILKLCEAINSTKILVYLGIYTDTIYTDRDGVEI